MSKKLMWERGWDRTVALSRELVNMSLEGKQGGRYGVTFKKLEAQIKGLYLLGLDDPVLYEALGDMAPDRVSRAKYYRLALEGSKPKRYVARSLQRAVVEFIRESGPDDRILQEKAIRSVVGICALQDQLSRVAGRKKEKKV